MDLLRVVFFAIFYPISCTRGSCDVEDAAGYPDSFTGSYSLENAGDEVCLLQTRFLQRIVEPEPESRTESGESKLEVAQPAVQTAEHAAGEAPFETEMVRRVMKSAQHRCSDKPVGRNAAYGKLLSSV